MERCGYDGCTPQNPRRRRGFVQSLSPFSTLYSISLQHSQLFDFEYTNFASQNIVNLDLEAIFHIIPTPQHYDKHITLQKVLVDTLETPQLPPYYLQQLCFSKTTHERAQYVVRRPHEPVPLPNARSHPTLRIQYPTHRHCVLSSCNFRPGQQSHRLSCNVGDFSPDRHHFVHPPYRTPKVEFPTRYELYRSYSSSAAPGAGRCSCAFE